MVDKSRNQSWRRKGKMKVTEDKSIMTVVSQNFGEVLGSSKNRKYMKLLKPVKKFLNPEEIDYDFESKVSLWNGIGKNERYQDNKCKNLSENFCSQFKEAMLILATSFKCGNEEIKQKRFSKNKYMNDIKKGIVLKDTEPLRLFGDCHEA